MVALGDELGADDKVDLALLDVGELLPQALDGGDEIAREHQDAFAREQRGDLFLEPLDAGPVGDERVLRLAFGARRGRRHGEPAVVAHESAPEAMVDQPCIAMRALQPEPAGPAQRERRIAAPV